MNLSATAEDIFWRRFAYVAVSCSARHAQYLARTLSRTSSWPYTSFAAGTSPFSNRISDFTFVDRATTRQTNGR